MGNQPTCYCADLGKFEALMKNKMKGSLDKWADEPRLRPYAKEAISEVRYRLPVGQDGISLRPMKPEDLYRLTYHAAAVIYHANLVDAYNNPYLKTGADKLLNTMNRVMDKTRVPCSCKDYQPLIIDYGNE